MKKLIAVSVIFLPIAAVILLNMALTSPNSGQGDVVLEIEPGESVRSVSKRLKDAGAIQSQLLFKIEARLEERNGKIKAGEFRLPKNVSIRDLVAHLTQGPTVLYRVTIPEGLTIDEVGAQLEKSNIVNKAGFAAGVNAYLRDGSRKIPYKSLEGYLFPETYHFRKRITAKEVVEAMTREFYRQVSAILPKHILNDPEALHRIITLASIIEKETGAGRERKRIASVFVNRLKKKMRLQSDPTVIYALPSFDGNLRKEDLMYDSPFNTYEYRGLPPGPIANPGLASINAAFRPAETDYLYFVSKNNGEHHFSKTLKEHNIAVQRYQLKKRIR